MRVQIVSGALFAVLLWYSPVAIAADSGVPVTAPWSDAARVMQETEADMDKSGILGISGHVDALEAALNEGAKAFPPAPAADGTITMLTDGMTETIAAMGAAAAAKQNAVAVENPYPRLGLYLGIYYNEIGKPEDALRVLNLGLKLTSSDLNLGAHLPNLYSEKAASLENLKRWTEGMQTCETGLALGVMEDRDRARLYRCRAFNLVELNRLDDAESSYRESLKLDPGNPLALRELDYIARLRAGGPRAPTQQFLPPPSPPPQQPSKPVGNGPQPT